MKRILAAVFLLLFGNSLFAQQEPAVDALKAQSMSLSLNQGKLQGPGAEFLLKETRDSRFVLIGEDHGLAEVPKFCRKELTGKRDGIQPAAGRADEEVLSRVL